MRRCVCIYLICALLLCGCQREKKSSLEESYTTGTGFGKTARQEENRHVQESGENAAGTPPAAVESEAREPEEEPRLKMEDYVRTAPGVSVEMLSADYWIARAERADQVIMTSSEIAAFNKRIHKAMREAGGPIYDLTELLRADAGTSAFLPETSAPKAAYYRNGKLLDGAFWESVLRNMKGTGTSEVLPGICVHRSDIRIYPIKEAVSESASDLNIEYDSLQYSAILPNEPVVIFRTSADKAWYYAYTYFGPGWIPAQDVAVCRSSEEWDRAREFSDYLIITGDRVRLEDDPVQTSISGMELYMGTKLELLKKGDYPREIGRRAIYDNYVVKIPARDGNGMLTYCYGLIPVSWDVSLGYLPYTTENVLRQAFKAQGDRYGWGGMYRSRDCSAYTMEVYRCFGFLFPRDGNPQGRMDCKKLTWDESVTKEERLNALKDVPPGSPVLFPGHIMMYLGQVDGEAYCISAVGGLLTAKGGTAEQARTAMLNTLSVYRQSGKEWLEALTEVLILTE